MGMFPGVTVNPELVNMPAIAATMREALYGWMNARIMIFDPKQAATTPYDPVTDTGGASVPNVVFDSGVNGAIVQPMRAATSVEFGSQNVGIVGVRFQVKRDLPSETLRSGLRLIVFDGGEDKSLETYMFGLSEGFDSSYGWGRTLEATVVTGGIVVPVAEPNSGFWEAPFGGALNVIELTQAEYDLLPDPENDPYVYIITPA